MICRMKYCDNEAVEETNRCEQHTKNTSRVSGNCGCGRPSKYSSGLCMRCYAREYKAVKKLAARSDTHSKNVTASNSENNGIYQATPISRDIWEQRRLSMSNDPIHIESEIYRLCALLRDNPRAKHLIPNLLADMPIALGVGNGRQYRSQRPLSDMQS